MGLKISNKRYEEIKSIIVDTFVKYDICCVPINGFELAIKMGVKVIPYSTINKEKRHLLYKKSEDGFSVQKNSGQWYIYYNDELTNYGRINNTIMHEVGHIVLDHTEDSELAETEVNFFSKYALAPPVLIHKFKLTNVIDIAIQFNISYEAAKYAMIYYRKWLTYGGKEYKQYEIIMLRQFCMC